MQPLLNKTIRELSQMIQSKELSIVELVTQVLDEIDQKNPTINAYIRWDRALAIERARLLDKNLDQGAPGSLLYGIPIANKDVICRKSVETTCSSKILKGYIPPYSATVIDRLEAAGAIILGNTNMDEFAMGSSTETSAFGVTYNPWDLDRIPGGSSGGSAAAVSGRLAIAALGTDTGGSIRQPAAHCGCVGLKPTYGRVSRYGLIAFGSSLDQIGPITRDVYDSAIILNAICGKDSHDSTSVDIPAVDLTQMLKGDIKGIKVGLPKEYFSKGIHPEVKSAVDKGVKLISDLGAEIEECSLPMSEYAVATYYILCTAEASSNLARYDGVRYGMRVNEDEGLSKLYFRTRGEGFGEEVKRRIILGTYVLSSGYYDQYYLKAQKTRTLIMKDFKSTFEKYDVILSATSPTPAFKIGERTQDPLTMYLSDIYTISANLAGIPGISLPCGFTDSGLPVGLQILSNHFDEKTLFRVAYAFQKNTDYHFQLPDIKGSSS